MPRQKKTQRATRFLITNNIRNVARKTRDIAQKVLYGRNDLSPNFKGVLRKMGEVTITGMTIGRSITNALTTGVINALSNAPYDKLYHLFLQIKTNMGDALLEKKKLLIWV